MQGTKKNNLIKASFGSRLFDVANVTFLSLFSLSVIYPFVYLISVSLTPNPAAINPMTLIPKTISTASYESVISSKYILTGYGNTFLRVILATVLVMATSVLAAYPLANKELPFRTGITGMIVFTMFFSGGLIPNYLLIKQLGMMNTIWALILPGLVPTFNMLIIRNYFMQLPPGLEESARIDGANDYRILFQIVLPISVPIIATVVLWTIVGHWNAWFDGMLYITNPKRQVLQTILRQIVIAGQLEQLEKDAQMAAAPDSVKAATIVFATAPVICFYPFIQKYFVKGIMVGALKG